MRSCSRKQHFYYRKGKKRNLSGVGDLGTLHIDMLRQLGRPYTLAKNEQNNHLHGGITGFNRVVWDREVVENGDASGVRFTYLSPDGEEGYPGNVLIKVSYMLNNKNELIITYDAETDQKTLLTVTNHSYFNLSGNLKRDILHHTLKLKSNKFLNLIRNSFRLEHY